MDEKNGGIVMKNNYIFPAILEYAEDGVSVSFPDLKGCFSYGDTEEEAMENAKEALELHLFGMEEEGIEILEHTPIKELKCEEKEIITLIRVWMIPVRDQMKNKAVKKTLTVPAWLNDEAVKQKVNFSAILQASLKDYLGIELNRV